MQNGRKIGEDFESCLALIKSWLQDCDEHDKCRMRRLHTNPLLPKRVLDVGSDGAETIRLYETRQENAPYVCLSHCWGSKQLITTTNQTLDERKRRIPLSALPPTFREAVVITRRLGVRYLWIDSLCILQDRDDRTDWADQSDLMFSIYANAFLTIAATRSVDSSGGLFKKPAKFFVGERIPNSNLDVYIRMPLRHPIHDANSNSWGRAHYYVTLNTRPFAESPLLTRAWAFQERIFSNRVVHFGEHELVWECSELTCCECTVSTLRRSLKQQFLPALEPPKSTRTAQLSQRDLPDFVAAWRNMVSAYRPLKLTHETDRLHACSSFARQMQPLMGGRYLAGLWEVILLEDLCWYRMDEWPPSARPSTYIAPTWAWPSVQSEIFWGDRMRQLPSRLKEPYTEVLQAQTTLATDSAYGAVAAGYLVLRGPVVEATYQFDSSTTRRSDRYSLRANSSKLEFVVDYSLESPGSDQVPHGEAVLLLAIGQKVIDVITALVVRKCGPETWQRIGFVMVRLRSDTLEHPNGYDAKWKVVFEQAPKRELKIM